MSSGGFEVVQPEDPDRFAKDESGDDVWERFIPADWELES